jgi:hypothetical protein
MTWARRQRNNVLQFLDQEHAAGLNSVNVVIRRDCIKVSRRIHHKTGGVEIRIFGSYYAGRVHYPDAPGDPVGDAQVACGIHGNARGTQHGVQGWLANLRLVGAWVVRAGAWRRLAVRQDPDHDAGKLRGIEIPLPVDRHVAGDRLPDGSNHSIRSNVPHAASYDVQTTTTIRG